MTSTLQFIPPGLIIILGALILPFVKDSVRQVITLCLPTIALALIWFIGPPAEMLAFEVAGFTINPYFEHDYTRIFATVFCIALFTGALFGLFQSKPIETCFAYLYGGSALGAIYSQDLISLFFFWEFMAVGSTLLIFASDQPGARKAGMRYALMHFMGGVVLMSGIALYLAISGDASIRPFNSELTILFPTEGALDMHGAAAWLILIGILINAAMPPFSSWLPDAYPQGSAFGSVYLSAFTTKTAVFVLLALFPGTELLIYLGVIMIFYGIIYAILENDMRRILAYSIMNQVGFMVTGIGIGTELALQGVATHAFCHIIYKALLFMSAGSVLYMTGKSKCSELGGLYKTMRLTCICGSIGALAISAFPLTSGFVSKALISSAAGYEQLEWVWYALVAASAGVFLHAGIKFPWFVFFQKDSGMRPKDPPLNMQIAMVILAALCIIPAIPGVAHVTLYKMLPTVVTYETYTFEHVVSYLQLLLFSGLAFFVMLGLLKRTETISLDFDWIYRHLASAVISWFVLLLDGPVRLVRMRLKRSFKEVAYFLSTTHGPESILARQWPIGATVMWSVVLLGLFMIVYVS